MKTLFAPEDIGKFISTSPAKTKPMEVYVDKGSGMLEGPYNVPAGFQLDRYVMFIYPQDEIHVSFTDFGMTVEVVKDDEVVQVFHGIREDGVDWKTTNEPV
jgi:hypothetical protein